MTKESEKEPEQEQPKENKVSENSQVEITLDDLK